MKICIYPTLEETHNAIGGVHFVAKSHIESLVERGHKIVPEQHADLVVCHAAYRPRQRPVDVLHLHGMYPTAEIGFDTEMFKRINRTIGLSIMEAYEVTTVCEWGADIVRRQFHARPHVIYNGLNLKDYEQSANMFGKILFPKLSVNATSDIQAFSYLVDNLKLAEFANLSDRKFSEKNVVNYGKLPHDEFIKLLKNSAIFLAITKENHSVAVMEAMASGVPVVGYDFGGTGETLVNHVGCELVTPGDYLSLKCAIDTVMDNWLGYSDEARKYALAHFGLEDKIDSLIDIYESALAKKQDTTRRVSVVIPCHNYGNYLPDAINSVINQTVKPHEIIVVDDFSTDNTPEVMASFGEQIIPIRLEENKGVSFARNTGIGMATGDYITCLDADDMLMPSFIEKHVKEFDRNSTGIVFAPIELVNEQGVSMDKVWFRNVFNVSEQRRGANNVPSCCMFRREAWIRAGGYRKRYQPAEDAEMWLRIANLGYHVKNAPGGFLMRYRVHQNNVSKKGFGDWYSDKLWMCRLQSSDTPFVDIVDPDKSKIIFSIQVKKRDEIDRLQDTLDSIEAMEHRNWLINVFIDNNIMLEDNIERIIPVHLSGGHPFVKFYLFGDEPEVKGNAVIELKAGEKVHPDFYNIYFTNLFYDGFTLPKDMASVNMCNSEREAL